MEWLLRKTVIESRKVLVEFCVSVSQKRNNSIIERPLSALWPCTEQANVCTVTVHREGLCMHCGCAQKRPVYALWQCTEKANVCTVAVHREG